MRPAHYYSAGPVSPRLANGTYDCVPVYSQGKALALMHLNGMAGWALRDILATPDRRKITISVYPGRAGPSYQVIGPLQALFQVLPFERVWLDDSTQVRELTVLLAGEPDFPSFQVIEQALDRGRRMAAPHLLRAPRAYTGPAMGTRSRTRGSPSARGSGGSDRYRGSRGSTPFPGSRPRRGSRGSRGSHSSRGSSPAQKPRSRGSSAPRSRSRDNSAPTSRDGSAPTQSKTCWGCEDGSCPKVSFGTWPKSVKDHNYSTPAGLESLLEPASEVSDKSSEQPQVRATTGGDPLAILYSPLSTVDSADPPLSSTMPILTSGSPGSPAPEEHLSQTDYLSPRSFYDSPEHDSPRSPSPVPGGSPAHSEAHDESPGDVTWLADFLAMSSSGVTPDLSLPPPAGELPEAPKECAIPSLPDGLLELPFPDLTSPACPPVEAPAGPPEEEQGETSGRKLSVSERVEAILQSLSLPKSPSSSIPDLSVEPLEAEDVKPDVPQSPVDSNASTEYYCPFLMTGAPVEGGIPAISLSVDEGKLPADLELVSPTAGDLMEGWPGLSTTRMAIEHQKLTMFRLGAIIQGAPDVTLPLLQTAEDIVRGRLCMRDPSDCRLCGIRGFHELWVVPQTELIGMEIPESPRSKSPQSGQLTLRSTYSESAYVFRLVDSWSASLVQQVCAWRLHASQGGYWMRAPTTLMSKDGILHPIMTPITPMFMFAPSKYPIYIYFCHLLQS